MRQIIFTIILILSFCFAAYGTSPFDRYRKLSWKDEMVRLDNLAIALTKDKDYKVSLRLHLGKKDSKDKARKRIERMFSFLTDGKRWKIDRTRISFAIFEEDDEDEERTEYWVMESGIQLSDCENCQTIKGEEFEQRINEIFPKK